MDDLIVFLRAQLDEDERIARGADPGPWKNNSLGRHDQSVIKLGAPTSTSLIHFDGSRAAANGAHVARHDPARVLREIEAKRAIVDAHERRPMPKGDTADCAHCWGAVWPCPTLRLIASVYDDRPSFQEAWRP